MTTKSLLILAGDGIGPEVMAQVKRVITWFNAKGKVTFEVEDGLVGGCAYDAHGTPLTDATMAKAMAADAVLLGAVGGPKWDSLPFGDKPERGLLRLRKDMQLFANLRPAFVFDALAEASTLKTELVRGLDIMIVRELTGGVYFGEPRGIETLPNGERRGINTQVYTTSEIIRIAEVAFELAAKRNGRLHSVEKANVMESGVLWREEVTKLGKAKYPDIHARPHVCRQLRDAAGAQPQAVRRDRHRQSVRRYAVRLRRDADRFARHAALGLPGRRRRFGQAPRALRAGARLGPRHRRQGIANPLACLLSFAMMLRYSFDMSAEADLLDGAIKAVLDSGKRTGDIMQPGATKVSTSGMGDAVLAALGQ